MNERQLELLRKLQGGEGLGSDPGLRRTAYALRDRGLLAVARQQGEGVRTQVTEAGVFYLEHGHHPDDPKHVATERKEGAETRLVSYADRPVARARRAKAEQLVERLVAERRVVFPDPDEDEVGEWRRVIDYAKRHGLVPPGRRIEKQRLWNRGRDLQISLEEGPHPNEKSQRPGEAPTVRVPTQIRKPHRAMAAFMEDDTWLHMPPAPRARSLRILQALCSEAERRGHQVAGPATRGRTQRSTAHGRWAAQREGYVELTVDGFPCRVTIKREFPESMDPERAVVLMIELPHSRSGRQSKWADRKRWKLEDVLGTVLREIELRAVDDAQRKADEERAAAERKALWVAAMDEARGRAVEAQLAEVLREQSGAWRDSRLLNQYCDALERRLVAAGPEESGLADARRWLDWARHYARSLDPLVLLPGMPKTRELEAEDLKPFLRGWSPYGPSRHGGS
ncbi:hypothetical protein [Streptomyces sp. ISL-94]|uniref:hypothetical protein n=1 Tax=Streptomyces sp. ISL-94 TaxID=2819190 RepID=UPI0020364930|nr:hypothetical protein [Streptomyces sp. ISL-94]